MRSCVDSTYDYNSNVIIPMLLLIGGRSWHRKQGHFILTCKATDNSLIWDSLLHAKQHSSSYYSSPAQGWVSPSPWISGCCRGWQWVWWHCVYVWQLCMGEGMDVCHNSCRWLRLFVCHPTIFGSTFFLNISFIFVLCVRMICLSLCVYASHECPVSTEARRSTGSLELYSQTVVNHNTSTGN